MMNEPHDPNAVLKKEKKQKMAKHKKDIITLEQIVDLNACAPGIETLTDYGGFIEISDSRLWESEHLIWIFRNDLIPRSGKNRKLSIKNKHAFEYALHVDKGPRDDTRAAAISEGFGYKYALHVDGCPHDDTRAAAISEGYGYQYALHIDKCPHDDTRAAANTEGRAYQYALSIDGCPHDDTRAATISGGYGFYYAISIDKGPRDDTRAAAISEGYGYQYARDIDKTPRDDTRAASISERSGFAYARDIDKYPRDDTRAAAISEGRGYLYALEVDECYRDDTRAAAISEGRGYLYARHVDKGPHDDTRAAAISGGCGYLYLVNFDYEKEQRFILQSIQQLIFNLAKVYSEGFFDFRFIISAQPFSSLKVYIEEEVARMEKERNSNEDDVTEWKDSKGKYHKIENMKYSHVLYTIAKEMRFELDIEHRCPGSRMCLYKKALELWID